MRGVTLLALLALAGCGDGSSTVVGLNPGTSFTPAPTPVPAPQYSRYVDLAGNHSFKSACASIATVGNQPVVAAPATAFGDGFTLDYAAATQAYALSGQGITRSFGPANRDLASPSNVFSYNIVVNDIDEQINIGYLSTQTTAPDYHRFINFTAESDVVGAPIEFGCVIGAPTLATDLPSGSNLPFANVKIEGAAYVWDGLSQKIFSLASSTATLAINATSGIVYISTQLTGTPDAGGSNVSLGNFSGSGQIDLTKASYTGTLATTVTNPSIDGTFGGWFFGPQAAEGALTLTLSGKREGTNEDITIIAVISAIRK